MKKGGGKLPTMSFIKILMQGANFTILSVLTQMSTATSKFPTNMALTSMPSGSSPVWINSPELPTNSAKRREKERERGRKEDGHQRHTESVENLTCVLVGQWES